MPDTKPPRPVYSQAASTSTSAVDPARYEVVSQHWIHAEQIRWTLLYNILMADTLILLAWAAVFGATNRPPGTRWALAVLCAAGFLVSFISACLEYRANQFTRFYTRLGRTTEKKLGPGPRPFRARTLFGTKFTGFPRLAQTHRVVVWVPALFSILFLVLAIISFKPETPPNQRLQRTPAAAPPSPLSFGTLDGLRCLPW